MFGDQPFTLHGSVGGSGADNHRPDVAKVETFLGDAGFYKPMTSDGPTGWHNTNLDSAIKGFQKANGLKVDGLLKPNGPTITRIGGLLGGGQAQPPAPKPAPKLEIANPIPAVPQSPWARPRPAAAQRGPFSGHAIAPDGAEAHDRYAQAPTRPRRRRSSTTSSAGKATGGAVTSPTCWAGSRRSIPTRPATSGTSCSN